MNLLSDLAFRVVVYGGKLPQVWPALGDARLDIELLGIQTSLRESVHYLPVHMHLPAFASRWVRLCRPDLSLTRVAPVGVGC